MPNTMLRSTTALTLPFASRQVIATLVLLLSIASVTPAHAHEWFVAPAATGNGSSGAPFGKIQQALAVAPSYTNGSLTTNTTYWYRVRAVNGLGASAYSNVVSITTS